MAWREQASFGTVKCNKIENTTYPTNGTLGGAGTGSIPATTATAGTNFYEYRLQSTATSGDARGIYNRLYLAGAGGSGESLRTFTTVSDVAAATAHGAHISLSFGTTGSITGLGVANRNTLHIPKAMTGGTYYVNSQEIWADAAASDVAGVTAQAFTNYNLGGDSTGAALIEDTVNLMHITGGTIAAGNLVAAKSSAAVSHTIRIKIGATAYWLMVSNAQ